MANFKEQCMFIKLCFKQEKTDAELYVILELPFAEETINTIQNHLTGFTSATSVNGSHG
jgi:hypothetical protein